MRAAGFWQSIATLLIFAAPAAAQTFREAVDLARGTEPTYLSAKANSAAQQEKSRQAFAGFLPEITATANTSSNHRDYLTRDGLIPPTVDTYNSHYGQINVTHPRGRSPTSTPRRRAEMVVPRPIYQLAAAKQDLPERFGAAWGDT